MSDIYQRESYPIIDFRQYTPLPGTLANLVDRPDNMRRYNEKYHLNIDEAFLCNPSEFEVRLDSAGIDIAVLAGNGATNDEVAEYCSQSERCVGIAGINPGDAAKARRAIARAERDGLRIVGLAPYKDGIPADDRHYYPIYDRCEENGMPVIIHCAFNFGIGMPLECGNPLRLDAVATDFPDLRIVASHAGWPWVPDMIAVAWHHEHVYLELSGHRAKYLGQKNSGWEMIFNYGAGPLRNRLLWGSVSPLLDPARQLEELRNLPFSDGVWPELLGNNALHLLTAAGAMPTKNS